MVPKVNWPLGNGQTLQFEAYGRNEGWNDVPGLYIFSYLKGGSWYAVYVGQASSFRERLPNHERLNEAIQKGATHIHATVVREQPRRDALEQMLISHLQPPLNTQHR